MEVTSMLNIEYVAFLTIALFVFGYTVLTNNVMKRVGYVCIFSSGIFLLWMVLASIAPAKTEGITYHNVIQKSQPDGTITDVVVIQDENGTHTVNLNSALGVKVPEDGRQYKIARVTYSKSVMGLFFPNRSSKYTVVPVN